MECVFEKFMDGMVAGCRIAVNREHTPTIPDLWTDRDRHAFFVARKLIKLVNYEFYEEHEQPRQASP
jgi:hypothetical protein